MLEISEIIYDQFLRGSYVSQSVSKIVINFF